MNVGAICNKTRLAGPCMAASSAASSTKRHGRLSVSSATLPSPRREQRAPARATAIPRSHKRLKDGEQLRTEATAKVFVDMLVAGWLSAFAAAERALRDNAGHLNPTEAGTRLHRLREQREQVASALETLVHEHHAATPLLRSSTSRP